MRAPTAPACEHPLPRSPRPSAWRPRSRRAGSVRSVQKLAQPRHVLGPQGRHRRLHAFVVAEHVPRAAAQRLGQPLDLLLARRRAARLDPQQLARLARIRRDARCSPSSRSRAARRSPASPAASHPGAAAPARPRACESRCASPVACSPYSERQLVEQPRLRSRPLVLHPRAQPRQLGPPDLLLRARQARAAPGSATTSSAAEEDRPAPRGTSPPISKARARAGPARRSSAPPPCRARTRASPGGAGDRRAGTRRSSPKSSALRAHALLAVVGARRGACARTVTPSAIANASARPSL